MTASNTIKIGQRVTCSLSYAGTGIVVRIHGEQSPGSCTSIFGGVGVTGGSAVIDVVWDNGRESKALPESLVRSSVQWSLHEEAVSAAEVAQAIALADDTARRREAQRVEADNAHEQAKAKLANDPAYKGLKRADLCDESPKKVAAANLRKLLKGEFPDVKFSVRGSSGAIDVRWTDGPTAEEVKALTDRFKSGHFDSMADGYEYQRSAWVAVFGGAQYVFLTRELSDAHIAQAIEVTWRDYAGNLAGFTKPTPEGIKSGAFSTEDVPGLGDSVAVLVRKTAARLA